MFLFSDGSTVISGAVKRKVSYITNRIAVTWYGIVKAPKLISLCR